MDPQMFGMYLQDILEQPRALRETLAAPLPIEALRNFTAKFDAQELDTVILTGMGASYHALAPLVLELVASGVRAQRLETSELLYHAPRLLHPRNLLIPVSQSGQSVEILKLLEPIRAAKIPCLAVTNTADSPLARTADAVIMTRAGAEFSVSSKTYIATLAALAMLSAAFTHQDLDARRAQLLQSSDMMEQYLAQWSTHVMSLMDNLKAIQHMVLVGRGPSLAAAGAGALILREAARLPCSEMSSAAFRHGPMEMIAPDLFVLVFQGIAPTQELNARLVPDIRAAGGHAALVQPANAADVFSLPPVAPSALPLMEFLVPEMIALALARLRGRVPGNFERNTKITTTE
jgi:glucosamine--fructose-6-phosphate aminotransferase (isomerizing)